MPLGNLTSQFFANVYLNELDQFVKHTLKIKYYIRYVDDFVLLHPSRRVLEECKERINTFLQTHLHVVLHPDKSKILDARHGITFLGFRVFPKYKLIRKKNLRKFERKFLTLKTLYANGMVSREYVIAVFEGWLAYVTNANTYKYRRHMTRVFTQFFPLEPATEIQNARKHATFLKKTEVLEYEFTNQKTLHLLKKGLTPSQVAVRRNVKESTVWTHIAQLIEYHQLSVWKILPKRVIRKILPHVRSAEDSLKVIKERVHDLMISYDMINCVRASLKQEHQKKNVARHVQWYKKVHCLRKCFWNPHQRAICAEKFDTLVARNPAFVLSRENFLDLFNNHMMICVLPASEKRRPVSWYEFVMYIKKYPPKH